MTPRPYQQSALDATHDSFERVDRSLIVMPTGTGKTVVFGLVIDAQRKGGIVTGNRPAVVLAHRKELLQQAVDKIASIDPWARIGLERGRSRATRGSEIIVTSVQTVGLEGSVRLTDVTPSLIIIDEAHHASHSNKTYWTPLERWGAFDGRCKVLGCTATPKRLDRQALHGMRGAMFEEVAYTYTIAEAWLDGWICTILSDGVSTTTNLDSVRSSSGDYNERQLAEAVDNGERTSAAFKQWLKVASDRRTVGFCVNVDHARHAAEFWRGKGFPADYVAGPDHMSDRQRERVLDAHKMGMVNPLFNCMIATEGYDDPLINCVLLMRPTKSWALLMQMLGRGTRICPFCSKKGMNPNCRGVSHKVDLLAIDVVDLTTKKGALTVPEILDLPPRIKLKGASLEDVIGKMRAIGPNAAAVLGASDIQTVDDIDIIARRVSLLDDLEPPAEVSKASQFAWLADGGGGFFLSIGGGRIVRLQPDALGQYQLSGPFAKVFNSRCDDIRAVLTKTDKFLLDRFGNDVKTLAGSKSKWRKNPPSEKQAAMLTRMGFNPKEFTRGRASMVIAKELEKRGRV